MSSEQGEGGPRGARRGSLLLISVTNQIGWTEIAAGWLESMRSASDGRRRSGSGALGEQLRSEHLPPLLNFLEAGAWQEQDQSQASTTK